MEAGMTVFKRQNETITADAYIAWSHTMLEEGKESPSLLKLSALTSDANLFEVESYFKQALKELKLELITIEPNSTMEIQQIAKQIVQETNEKELVRLAREIFLIVSELNYPADLMDWYEISEMQDRLVYDTVTPPYTQQEIILKMKEAARKML